MLNISIASKHYRNLLSRVLKGYLLASQVNKLRKALGILCDKESVYGARGVITMLDNLQQKSHVEKYI